MMPSHTLITRSAVCLHKELGEPTNRNRIEHVSKELYVIMSEEQYY